MSSYTTLELPSGWTIVRLGEVADVIYGKALPAEQRVSEGSIPVYGSSGIVGEHNEALHSEPSIIIGRKGTVGSVYYVASPFWCIDTAFYLSSINSAIDLEFLAHALRRIDLSRFSIVVGVPGINRNDITQSQIPLPPLLEQRRIVTILREADEIRRLRQQANRRAQQLLPSLFQEMFGDLRSSSNEWKIVSVDEAGYVQLGRQRAPKYQTGQYTRPYLRVANVGEDRIDISDLLSMDFNEREFPKYKLEYGDILLNEGQITELVGRPAMWRNEVQHCCFQNTLIRFRADRSKTDPNFALAVFLYYFRTGEFARLSSKTSTVAHLSAGRFAKMPFPLPPLSLQQDFAARVAEARQFEEAQTESFCKVNDLFQSLLAQAFSGKLTATWREQHRDELAVAAEERDRLLNTAKPEIQLTTKAESDHLLSSHPRYHLLRQLSGEQYRLYQIVTRQTGYFTAESLSISEENNLSLNSARQGLQLLAESGLVIRVSLPVVPTSGTAVYVPVYRYSKPDDEVRLTDLALLEGNTA